MTPTFARLGVSNEPGAAQIRQAADAVRGRIDWKYCLGMALTDPGFDFSVLSQFRARLVAHDLQGMAFEMLLDRLVELGLVKARGRQRTDATHVVAAVRDLNRLEMVGETLRAALETLAAAHRSGWPGTSTTRPRPTPLIAHHPLYGRIRQVARLGTRSRNGPG